MSMAATSTVRSIFDCLPEPKMPEAETSTKSITVSSRSSQKRLINGVPVRAVTFQSIVRMSSPGWYSRTSSNSMPRPRNTLLYCPAIRSLTVRLATIWIRCTFFKISLTFCSDMDQELEAIVK